jgi:magnesium-transporting ATPase (P-type)
MGQFNNTIISMITLSDNMIQLTIHCKLVFEKYKIMIMVMILCITLLCYCIYCRIHKYKSTIKYTTTSYESKTNLTNFHINNEVLSKDNTIYLTQYKYDGIILYILIIVSGTITYFRDPGNMFCLIVAYFKYYDFGTYDYGIITISFALIYVGSLVCDKHDVIKQQKKINDTTIYHDTKIYQKDLVRGDYITTLSTGDIVPADILILEGHVYVQELELTGEDIHVSKQYIPNNPNMDIVINHHKNEGVLHDNNQSFNYNTEHMVFRGTQITYGRIYKGIVIETGNDCKIYRVDTNNTRNKTEIQKRITSMYVINLYLLLTLSSLLGIIIYAKDDNELSMWNIMRKMISYLNTLLPLSLPLFFVTASKIRSRIIAQKHNVKINKNGTNSFQTNPKYIVSDKTGTLTTGQITLNHVYTKTTEWNVFVNAVSCSDIGVIDEHILKNDIVEYTLISELMALYNYKLSKNTHDTFIISDGKYDHEYKRLYHTQFDYKLEIKMSVVQYNNQITLHIQGTPESVNTYSNNGLRTVLENISKIKHPKNTYRRLIAHAKKIITYEQLQQLKINPISILKSDMEVSLYEFYDYVVPGVYKSIKSILDTDHDFTMLTGDKMTSAIEIGCTIGVIKSNEYYAIETIECLNKLFTSNTIQSNICYVINGRLLESLIMSSDVIKLQHIIKQSNRKIIYRASPNNKKLYIEFLQQSFREEVLMIGDGSNDIASLIQADVSMCIRHNDNNAVQLASDIVLNTWNDVPELISCFPNNTHIINNVIGWCLMKHMISAFILVAMLFVTNFDQLKEPTGAIILSFLNTTMFIVIVMYCYTDNDLVHRINIYKQAFVGIILGLLNAIFVLNQINSINKGIKILVCIQVCQIVINIIRNNKHYMYMIIMIIWIYGTYLSVNISFIQTMYLIIGCCIPMIVF